MGTDTPPVHPDTESWDEAVAEGYFGERTDPFPDTLYVPGIQADVAPTITAVSPNHGTTAGGDEVVIEGMWQFAPVCTIGGTAVTVGELIPGGLGFHCVTPPGIAGPADITVTTAGGTVTEAGGWEYQTPLPPTVTGIHPVSGPEAGGDSIQMVGSGMNESATFTFGGVPGTVDSLYADASGAYIINPPGTGVVDVTVTNADGTGTLPGAFTYEAAAPPEE